MANGALAEEMLHDENWEGTNKEWNGEIPAITEIREKATPVDHHRAAWQRKIDAALQGLKKDEERERQNILRRHTQRDLDLDCEE